MSSYNFHIFSLSIILLSTFLIAHSISICKNGRACPKNTLCSTDSEYCCQMDGKCNERSTWSLLENKCQNGHKCLLNEYCTFNDQCVNRDISMCDTYLQIEETAKCGNNGFLIKNGFEPCSKVYRHFKQSNVEHNNVMKCAEQCLISKISQNVHEKSSCQVLKNEAIKSFADCYVNCGMCLVSECWSDIFERANKWEVTGPKFEYEFANKCSQEYRNKNGSLSEEKIKHSAKSFVEKVQKSSGVDTTEIFADLLNVKDTSNSNATNSSNICPDCNKFPPFFFPIKTYVEHSLVIVIFSTCLLIFFITFIIVCCCFKKSRSRKHTLPSYSDQCQVRLAGPPQTPAPQVPTTSNEVASDSGYEYDATENPYERPTIQVTHHIKN